jgi:molecular chaperone GrpE
MSKERTKKGKDTPLEDEKLHSSEEDHTDAPEEEKDSTDLTDVDSLKKKIEELEDQYLRKQADFENFRKRMFREKEEAIKFANSSLILDLITIIDDFERAIKSSEESQDFATFHQGIEMIEKQFVSMLERNWGLTRFEGAGEGFDPEKHEALFMEETGDVDAPQVVEDYQKGYLLHNRVLRPAKVKVLMPQSESKSADNEGTDANETDTEEELTVDTNQENV